MSNLNEIIFFPAKPIYLFFMYKLCLCQRLFTLLLRHPTTQQLFPEAFLVDFSLIVSPGRLFLFQVAKPISNKNVRLVESLLMSHAAIEFA